MEALRLLVATVQHSGTRQLLSLIGRDFKMLHEAERAGPKEVLVAHLVDKRMPEILSYEGPIMTTRRSESDIRASWERRGRDPAELEQQLRNYERLLEKRPYVVELGTWRC